MSDNGKHSYFPSHVLRDDDLSTLTSFNHYDPHGDEGDQDNVLSKIFFRVRTAVSNQNVDGLGASNSSTSLVSLSSSKNLMPRDFDRAASAAATGDPLATEKCSIGDEYHQRLSNLNPNGGRSSGDYFCELGIYPYRRGSGGGNSPDDIDSTVITKRSSVGHLMVTPSESVSARASLDESTTMENGEPITKTASNDSDTQSVMTNFSVSNYHSLNRVIAQLRGENIKSVKVNKDYWMPDEQCKECFDCNARFTLFRRKHHCRICGQIFCAKCASDIINGDRVGLSGHVRVCKFCLHNLEAQGRQQEQSFSSIHHNRLAPDNNISEVSQEEVHPDVFVGLSPVLPGQKPLSAPKMQIPTTTVKSHQGEYGGQNSTTFALEIPPDSDIPCSQGMNGNSTSAAAAVQPPLSPIQQTHSDSEMSLKKLFLATIRPRSRTSTMNSVVADASLNALEKMNGRTSPTIPFRRKSFTTHLNNFVVDSGGGTIIPPTFSGNDSDDEDSPEWNKSPRNLLNFLGGNPDRTGLEDSMAIAKNDLSSTDDDNVQDPGSPKLRRRRADELWKFERPNDIRRRRSATAAPSRSVRQRTHSLMRNTPITTANLSMSDDPVCESPRLHPNTECFAKPYEQPLHTHLSSPTTGWSANLEDQQLRPRAIGQRHRRVSSTPINIELSAASLDHMRKMLRQLLDEVKGLLCQDPAEWEDVLMGLLLKVSDNVHPDVRGGDEIDVRHYVKIKKIAGGRPQDSYYVKGVVCSKNVAHKCMVKTIQNPRILILLFPLEWSRDSEEEQRLQSIDRVLAQEKGFLEKLVARIVALKPSVVLVSSNVSRIALDYLVKANIVVVYNVKLSTLEAVARCTGASTISSFPPFNMDGQLLGISTGPSLGHCGIFETRTLVHDLIPNRRKTFLIFNECPPELGATIILRGGTVEQLRIIKRITDFMVFVVHNLRLESLLLKDLAEARNTIQVHPSQSVDGDDITAATSPKEHHISSQSVASLTDKNSEITMIENPEDKYECLVPARDMIHRYESAILSASPLVGLPPPNLLIRLKETQTNLAALLAQQVPDALAQSKSNIPSRLSGMPSFFRCFDSLLAGDPEYDQLIEEHHQRSRALEAYIGDNMDTLTPSYHQHLVMVYMTVCSVTGVPCQGPEMRMFEYYRPDSDMTLGQYIEDIAMSAEKLCFSTMCERNMLEHYRAYGHGNAKVNVDLEHIQGPPPIMATNSILMWTYCKKCETNSLLVPMSESSWKYSFGKFLELMFHQTKSMPARAGACPHGMLRDHVHCFGYKGIAVRFQHETIEPHDVYVPPMHLYVNSKTQATLKDAALESTRSKITRFYDSVVERNKSFMLDIVQPDRVDECKEYLQDMSDRATGEKKQMLQFLQSVYATTPPSDTLSLNIVRIKLQVNVLQWDAEYAEFVRQYVRPERELRRHFKRMFPVETRMPSMIADLDLRTKRTTESPDLPLLDVGLDGYQDYLSENLDIVADVYPGLKEQPKLGESPTTASPWLEEEARLDSLLEQMMKDKVSNGGTPAATNGIQEVTSEASDFLDPIVARRLSLELMKDLPKKTIPARYDGVDSTPASKPQKHRGSYQRRQSTSSIDTKSILNRDIAELQPQKLKENEQERISSLEAPVHSHGPILPLLNSSAYKQFTNLFPGEPEIVHSRSSPLFGAKPRSRFKDGRKYDAARRSKHEPDDESVAEKRELALSGYRYGYKGSTERGSHRSPSARQYGRQQRPLEISSSNASPSTSLDRPDRQLRQQRQRQQQQQQQQNGSILPERSIKFVPTNNHLASVRSARGVRQRLPSKSSIEVYTTLRELVREESDDEFQVSDDSDDPYHDDERRRRRRQQQQRQQQQEQQQEQQQQPPQQQQQKLEEEEDEHGFEETHSTIFSLLNTDEYDESLGREILPHAPQQHTRFVRNDLPHLKFDEDDKKDMNSHQPSDVRPTHQNQQHHTIADFRLVNQPLSRPIPPHNNSMSTIETGNLDLSGSGSERNSFLRAITNMLAEKGMGNLLPLEYPLTPLEHVFPGSLIVVSEDEPSTIVAFTLSCDDYLKMLRDIRKSNSGDAVALADEQSIHNDANGSASSLYGDHMSEKISMDGIPTEPVNGMVIERTLRSNSGNHVKYYFADGTTKFFCKIFFVEQFDALRRNCGCEESYIASLATCCKWDSSGGKSGSVFLKTKDDRLLVKQISRYEMDAFLRFAPAYFQYMSEAFFHELPTVLSKNFGLYRIGYKNTATGKSMKMDILVMENLFYERCVKKIFDLKGSMRNRHVQATGRENEVLLDENMVELMFQSPLSIRATSKEMLRGCLHNDTLFLSRLDVMDYSLLVGVDEEKRELIVGIVDFIRTFTWDKKLESWVKESGILGGGGKEPTIISPKQYRLRFREAMDRYFLMMPDFWTTKLGRRHYPYHEDPLASL
ncbi:hypothetical protein BX666DRAFT_1916690 [Dichotomocladium elegans]|nr:hypothetical protein BX666DRAFT_1916690 [Dichotomocladium elegans]